MLLTDTLLQNRYRIVRQIGQGGMGAVYEAIDTRFNSTVALKKTLLTDTAALRAFKREAKLLYDLRHPALTKVIDYFTEGNGQYLVMEFIPGDDLATLMERSGGKFPPESVLTWVLRWGDRLLDALNYLHTQSPPIFHRDIKPQNLKLTKNGDIVLLDFGLAKGGGLSMRASLGDDKSKSIAGYTPNYAPWEQIRGEDPDPRSDLYSLSATLYHLATGVRPPDALSRAAAILNDQGDSLRLACDYNHYIPEPIAMVLHRAMALNADDRPPSAAAMRNSLRDAQRGKYPATDTTRMENNVQPGSGDTTSTGQAGSTTGRLAPQTESLSLQSVNASVAAQTVNITATGPLSVAAAPASSGGGAGSTTTVRSGPVNSVSLASVLIPGIPVLSLAISPDGSMVAVAGEDGEIGLWSIAEEDLVRKFEGHTSSVHELAFSSDGEMLVSGSEDNTMRLWWAGKGGPAYQTYEQDSPIESVAFSPDGRTLASGGWGSAISLYQVSSGRLVETAKLDAGFVHSLAFSPDGTMLAAGCYDTRIYLWKLQDKKSRLVHTLKGHNNFVLSIAFSPDGRKLASGGGGTEIYVWRLSDGRHIDTLKGHSNFVRSLAFSPDGQTLASGSEDRTVRLWRVVDGSPIETLEGHNDGITGVAFAPDGRSLLSCSRDTKVRLWNIE
jgi:WD40 repeat protein